MPPSTGAKWVCLDVGETLIDETRVWTCWADEIGVTRLTFLAALGAAIAAGDFRAVFDTFDVDWRALAPAVEARFGGFSSADLYPDAVGSVEGLRRAGYRVAVVANQPTARSAELRQLGVMAEVMAMSEELGVHKPDPRFFTRTLELLGSPAPADVAYVGDRLDNDVRPSAAAGMRAVWIRRGPWALLCGSDGPEAELVVDSLDELAEGLAGIW